MTKVTAKEVKQLRQATGAGIMAVKKALEEAKGNKKKAREILKKKGLEKLKKRAGKATGEGQVYSYIHAGGRVGAMVMVKCETDFVARSQEFETLCKELAMQVASMKPKNVKELLKQDYIRDPKKKVGDLVKEMAAKVKENVLVEKIVRLSL
jgi:elongation factor Ts